MARDLVSAGEQLAHRALAKETRAGVEHYVTGQHGAQLFDGIYYLSYVDTMGHLICIPFLRDEHGWRPAGVYARAGQEYAEPMRSLPTDWKPSAAMMSALEAAR